MFYLIGGLLVLQGSVSLGALVAALAAYKDLSTFMESAPPHPVLEGGNKVVERPTYPDWADLIDPND